MEDEKKTGKQWGCPKCGSTDRVYSVESMYVLVPVEFDDKGRHVYTGGDQRDCPDSMEQVSGPDRYHCGECDAEFPDPVEIKDGEPQTETKEAPQTDTGASEYHNADELLRSMDPQLFAAQRIALCRAYDDGEKMDPARREHLDGLINFLDIVADYAHDVLGLDCLIKPEDVDDPPEGVRP